MNSTAGLKLLFVAILALLLAALGAPGRGDEAAGLRVRADYRADKSDCARAHSADRDRCFDRARARRDAPPRPARSRPSPSR